MNDDSHFPASGAVVAEEASVFEQVSMMRKAFMASPVRNAIFGYAMGILAVIARHRASARSSSTAGTSPSTMPWSGATSTLSCIS